MGAPRSADEPHEQIKYNCVGEVAERLKALPC